MIIVAQIYLNKMMKTNKMTNLPTVQITLQPSCQVQSFSLIVYPCYRPCQFLSICTSGHEAPITFRGLQDLPSGVEDVSSTTNL